MSENSELTGIVLAVKIKVLHIVTRLGPGGVTETLRALSKYVNKGAFEFFFVSGLENDLKLDKSKKAIAGGMNLKIIPGLKRNINPWSDLLSLISLYLFIKKGNFDIVHTHTSKAGFLGRIAARLAKVPVTIHQPHGHVFKGMFDFFTTRLFIFLEKTAALITDKIITVTRLGKEEHIRYGIASPDKFIVIPSGIDLERFLKVEVDIKKGRRDLGIENEYPIVGTVAHLVKRKGYLYLLKAISQVKKIHSKIKVLIVGEGALRPHLEKQVKKMGLERNFLFLGEREDVEVIYPLLDLFVLSSVNEGMGRVLIEAMASGRPVAAARIMGIPELVIDGLTGRLASPKDSDALAEAIIDLLGDKEKLSKMGLAAKKKVEASSQFDDKVMVKRIESLYQELTKSIF